MRLFHNYRIVKQMKNNKYIEPAVAWEDDDTAPLEQSGIAKFGVHVTAD